MYLWLCPLASAKHAHTSFFQAEVHAYLNMANNDVEQAVILLQRDWTLYSSSEFGSVDCPSIASDTLLALEMLG